MKKLLIFPLLCAAFSLAAQMADPETFGKTITPADLRAHLTRLASPEFGGRETGEEGQRKAADYIAAHFKNLGLPTKGQNGTYFQKVVLRGESWTELALKINGEEYRNRVDFCVYPAYNNSRPMTKVNDVVFVGYGIEEGAYNDYGKANVAGKVVVFYEGEPKNASGQSLLPTGAKPWDWRRKALLAKQKGAILALIVDPFLTETVKTNRKMLSTYGWKTVAPDEKDEAAGFVNTMFISNGVANSLLAKSKAKVDAAMSALNSGQKYKPVKVKTSAEVILDKSVKQLEGSNVVGVIEGSDLVLKDEYVFITGHYDHLGRVDDIIYYGADDNGSGTSGVLEIAQAFAEAKKQGFGPKRTVVCMLVSGEEKGLLGSRYYVDYPLFPLDKTVVDINIDMIGRLDDEHLQNPNYVYVIGSDRLSTELHAINEKVNTAYTKLTLDYKYNDRNDPNHFYERSDHYNFAERGIPAIFYFNGTHIDYHKPSDRVEKIEFEALAKRAQLAFYTGWEVANRPGRLIVDVKQ